MEFIAGVLFAAFVGFIAKKVKDSRAKKKAAGGAGTASPKANRK